MEIIPANAQKIYHESCTYDQLIRGPTHGSAHWTGIINRQKMHDVHMISWMNVS